MKGISCVFSSFQTCGTLSSPSPWPSRSPRPNPRRESGSAVSEQPSGHRDGLAVHDGDAGVGMARIVQPDVAKVRLGPDLAPERFECCPRTRRPVGAGRTGSARRAAARGEAGVWSEGHPALRPARAAVAPARQRHRGAQAMNATGAAGDTAANGFPTRTPAELEQRPRRHPAPHRWRHRANAAARGTHPPRRPRALQPRRKSNANSLAARRRQRHPPPGIARFPVPGSANP